MTEHAHRERVPGCHRCEATADELGTETLLRVATVEAPGYHGHGPLAGTPVHILRLGICNLACAWCDHPETVAALGAHLDTTAPYTSTRALLDRLAPQLDADPEMPLLITGGEPLLQDHAILDLTQRLADQGRASTLWVETNGTIPPPQWWTDWISHTIVSPKLGTHDPVHRHLPPAALTRWAELAHIHDYGGRLAHFDFTVATRSDVLLAAELCNQYGLSPRHCSLTPRGTGHDTQCASLAAIHDTALEHGFGIDVRPRQLLTNPVEAHRVR